MLFVCATRVVDVFTDPYLYVLDTDDLVIEKIQNAKLVLLYYSGNVELANVKVSNTGLLGVKSCSFRTYLSAVESQELSMLGGKVRYIANDGGESIRINGREYPLRVATVMPAPLPAKPIKIGGMDYRIGIVSDASEPAIRYKVVVGEYETEAYNLQLVVSAMGVHYIYMLGGHIIVAMGVTLTRFYYKLIYIIFTEDGRFVGVVPEKSIVGNVYDTGEDTTFLSKFVLMNKNGGTF